MKEIKKINLANLIFVIVLFIFLAGCSAKQSNLDSLEYKNSLISTEENLKVAFIANQRHQQAIFKITILD